MSPTGRRTLAALSFAAAVTGARQASAQSVSDGHCANLAAEKDGGFEWGRPPLRNTVGYRTLSNALLSNAQAYGAASMAERRLIPLLSTPTAGTAFDVDSTFTFGAVKLPLCPKEPGERPAVGSVDLSVVNVGFGVRFGFVGLFLASSVASHTVYSSQNALAEGVGRGTVMTVMSVGALSYLPVGLVKSEFYRENVSLVYTNIGGAALFTPIGPITGGYASTGGFFTNFTGSVVPVFASALLASSIEQSPYLAAGIASIAPLTGKGWRDSVGDTAVSARRLQFVGLAPTGVSTRDLGSEAVKRTPFVTQHFEQSGIGKVVDVTIVTTSAPQPNLYEATLGLHSPGYRSPRSLQSLASGAGKKDGGVSVTAGVVRLPNLWFYGVEGGYRLKAAVSFSAGPFSAGLAVNDTEILSVFPYAYNAPQFSMMIAGATE